MLLHRGRAVQGQKYRETLWARLNNGYYDWSDVLYRGVPSCRSYSLIVSSSWHRSVQQWTKDRIILCSKCRSRNRDPRIGHPLCGKMTTNSPQPTSPNHTRNPNHRRKKSPNRNQEKFTNRTYLTIKGHKTLTSGSCSISKSEDERNRDLPTTTKNDHCQNRAEKTV